MKKFLKDLPMKNIIGSGSKDTGKMEIQIMRSRVRTTTTGEDR